MLHGEGVLLVDCPHYLAHVVLVESHRVGVVAYRPDVLRFGFHGPVAGEPTFLFAPLGLGQGLLGLVGANCFAAQYYLADGLHLAVLLLLLDDVLRIFQLLRYALHLKLEAALALLLRALLGCQQRVAVGCFYGGREVWEGKWGIREAGPEFE